MEDERAVAPHKRPKKMKPVTPPRGRVFEPRPPYSTNTRVWELVKQSRRCLYPKRRFTVAVYKKNPVKFTGQITAAIGEKRALNARVSSRQAV
jgi:hypothetical protein